MKKSFFGTLYLVILSLIMVSCGGTDRMQQIKVLNWADYIDENVKNGFEQWYYEQTGEKIELVYETFDINETALTKIEVGHEDYDVFCPSEYIIERMFKKGLLLPIDKSIIPDSIYYFDNISPFVTDKFQQMAPTADITVSDYAVGYMWGTTGFIYNPQYVDVNELQSWDAILNPKFANRILMKDAFRDVYSPLLIYANHDKIVSGEVKMDDLMHDSSDESIAVVEALLKQAKPYVAGWEADFGKEMMTQNKAWINLMWSGDAVWAIEEAAEVGVSLDYVVPEEGSVVWFDGWVIPKYAKNPRAARYFINYMCAPENAVRNMDATGYVSVVATEEVLRAMDPLLCAMDETEDEAEILALQAERDALLEEEGVDLSYFFKDEAGNPLTFDMGNGYMVHADCV